MLSGGSRLIVVGLLLLALGQSAFGGEFSDPSGFSFTYPDGWIPVNRQVIEQANNALPPEIKNWVTKNKIDFNQVKVVVVHGGDPEFVENINVVVTREQLPLNDRTVKELPTTLSKQFGAIGATIQKLDCRIEKVGSQQAAVVNFESKLPTLAFPLRQRQVFFAGGGNTYIVTVTAKADTFDQNLPAIESILASFHVPAPINRGFDWKRVLIMGLVGGLVGGLIGLFKLFSGKKPKPKKRRPVTPRYSGEI